MDTQGRYTLAKLCNAVISGCRPHEDGLKPFTKCWDELSVEQGCMFTPRQFNGVVIPYEGRRHILHLLHEGHQGSTRMKALSIVLSSSKLYSSFVWCMARIRCRIGVRIVKDCDLARRPITLLRRHAPLHPWEFPATAWEHIHIDYAGPYLGRMFLVVVDAFSKWLEVVPVSAATSPVTIEKLRNIFATHGLPRVLVSDNGSQFTSTEFQTFLRGNGILSISVPRHTTPPQTALRNG